MKHNSHHRSSFRWVVVIGAGIILASCAATALLFTYHYRSSPAALYPELADFQGKFQPFDELKTYFARLAEEKGGAYAFEVLKRAKLPPNTDLHLLGHAVGDVLYRQQGVEGIQVCTNDFRNACSHSIVVGLYFDEGVAAIPKIAEVCRKAPGGSGAYTMCFHGLGHGILAATGYNMTRTADVCGKTSPVGYKTREPIECMGGAVMEIISGGGHDHEVWEIQRKQYLDPKHPLSLCLSDFMPKEARSWCFIYVTPYLFEAAGADLGHPMPVDFEKAFRFCDALPASDEEDRGSCFGGFGKEFVVLAQDRDIRAISDMNASQLATVYDWCGLAGERKGRGSCVGSALQSLFWGGENDPKAAVLFCSVVTDPQDRQHCYDELIGAVSYYIADPAYRGNFCAALPADEASVCRQRILNVQ